MVELGTAAEIEPPNFVVLFHFIVDTSKNPDTAVPDPAGVIVTRDESPGARPGPCLEIEVANVVQDTIMACLPAADIQFVVVDYCRVASPSAWYWSMKLGLRPMRCLEVEDYDVGEMLAVLVLAAKDKKLVPLP